MLCFGDEQFTLSGEPRSPHGLSISACPTPRVPFQTPVKSSPIDMTFESGLDRAGEESGGGSRGLASLLQHSMSYELSPEVLERKLSRFSTGSDDEDERDLAAMLDPIKCTLDKGTAV